MSYRTKFKINIKQDTGTYLIYLITYIGTSIFYLTIWLYNTVGGFTPTADGLDRFAVT